MHSPYPWILVVDDDPDILILLGLQLEHLGYAVRTATHGTEALAILADTQPALVLLDLRLPRLSGLDVLKQLRQTAPDLTVIVMTAYATVEKAVEAMKAGAYDFLIKPLTPGHLELVVQKALERQAVQRAQHLLQPSWRGRCSRSSARAPRSNRRSPMPGALRRARPPFSS